MAETVIFYILAGIILAFSMMTVTSRVILRAAVYLLFVLCATAGIYFMMEYNFLGAVQLTVYGGGVVVLVIFAILLTSQIGELLPKPDLRKQLFGGLAAFAGALLSISVIVQYEFRDAVAATGPTQDVKYIGEQLLNYGDKGYVLPFEVISVLLLAAMIGAIVIAKRDRPDKTEIEIKEESQDSVLSTQDPK